MNELVSEEALPEWLRQASEESVQPTQRQPVPGPDPYSPPPAYQPAYPPTNQPAAPAYGGGYAPMPISAGEPPLSRPDASAFPSLESAGSYQGPLAGGGMSASSLLDPNALPSWLGGQQSQATSDGLRGGEGMRAQSLVDETALPEWLRTEPAPQAQMPAAPPPAPGWGVSAAAPGAMPVSPAAPLAPAVPQAPASPYGGSAGVQPPTLVAANGQQNFSAGQLIDPDALPDWMKAQDGAGMAPPAGAPPAAQGRQGPWSASDLIDPAMLPGWVRGNDPAMAQGNGANGANAAMAAMPPGANIDAPRAPTGRMPAPQSAYVPQTEQDFGASRAGTSQRAAAPRGNSSARPLSEYEKPTWLREDSPNEFGPDDMRDNMRDNMAVYPPERQDGRQDRNGRSWNGYTGQGNGGYSGQYGQPRQRGQQRQRGRAPVDQTGQSWAAPDGYESSPWSRPRPPRHDERAAPKKRKGGFFGFLRRG